jgi:hypothetical protein
MQIVNTPSGPINTWHNYADRFRITRTTTVALRDHYVLENFKRCGFNHIRQLHYDYNKITREPTIGCYVELSVEPDVGTIPIDSSKGRKLIKRSSYF